MASREGPQPVEPGSPEAAVVEEELALLARVQRQLARDGIAAGSNPAYDGELLSLRDQIAEARTEDIAPLIAEMHRMQALGAANGKGRDLPVDVACPYFGHLKLDDGKKVRDVLIGSRGFVKPGSEAAIVDWRNAPVSRIYYCYEEGDDYEESFGGRAVRGTVAARRTVSIVGGELRRVSWANGTVARRGDGSWVQIPLEHRPVLRGGAGVAVRPPSPLEAPPPFRPGALGVVGDESLREDKHLREITALIDPAQFAAITRPDSGIVVLQGGAGSGKTTVALHRAAYLHFQDPSTFAPRNMAVVVKSAPLTEYISRLLPSLDVAGTPVVTLGEWMERTRKKVLPEVAGGRAAEVPAAVARLKKHPAVLHLLGLGVAREAAAIEAAMLGHAEPAAHEGLVARWRDLGNLALLPRVRELGRWLEGAAAERLGLSARARASIGGVLRRARALGADVHGLWSQLLTDRALLREAFASKGRGAATDEELDELVRWVTRQSERPASEDDDDDDDDERPRRGRGRRDEAEALASLPAEDDGDDDHDPLHAGLGVDGRAIDEDAVAGRLDEHDDALLLRLTQLIYGGLPVAGSGKTVTHEHLIVDEAQDLSPTDIAVLRGSLTKRESMTLAGDTAQKLIFDNGFDDWGTMLEDVGVRGVVIEPLRISYRSTRPIVEFARHVLGPLADPDPPAAQRDGVAVEQFSFGSTGECLAFLAESLRALLLRERRANIAVVTRYSAQAELYHQGLAKAEIPSLRRVHGRHFSFTPGVDVVDVGQVKGLEYDYVILAEAGASSYPDGREARHLMHIAATRAVHQLWVTSVGAPSPLLPPERW